MARIIIGSYMVRYPLGGMMSWVLQYLVGFQQLGHDVYLVEKSAYPNSCYDPTKHVMTDDCSVGIATVSAHLRRFGLQDSWCFVDAQNCYHGMVPQRVAAIFDSAEVFVELGGNEAWHIEARTVGLRVLVDGDPGFTQMRMENRLAAGEDLPEYDFYYTTGRNIGTRKSTAPTAGQKWRPIFQPVVVDLVRQQPINPDAPFTTVMNWRSYDPIEYRGVTYGQKDMEFRNFLKLPRLTAVPLEIAVSGRDVPTANLTALGWRIRDAHAVTMSFDSFIEYILASAGEFSVCKNAYVATNSGWFSDRSAAYLASGRPVVMQDTGFSCHLPCGHGLFAVRTVDEAAAALNEINGDYVRHSKSAREIAMEFLDAPKVLGRFLREIGL